MFTLLANIYLPYLVFIDLIQHKANVPTSVTSPQLCELIEGRKTVSPVYKHHFVEYFVYPGGI